MSANPVAAESPTYIMGRTSEEYARLKRQAQVWEPTTKSVLERAGITPWNALPRCRLRSRRGHAADGPIHRSNRNGCWY